MPAKPQPIDTSTYSGKFAANLRKLRHDQKLTVLDVVESLRLNGYEIASRSYYNWDTGRSDPPFNALPALAATFGLSGPHELFIQPDAQVEQVSARMVSGQLSAESNLARIGEVVKNLKQLAQAAAESADCVIVPRKEYTRLKALDRKGKR